MFTSRACRPLVGPGPDAQVWTLTRRKFVICVAAPLSLGSCCSSFFSPRSDTLGGFGWGSPDALMNDLCTKMMRAARTCSSKSADIPSSIPFSISTKDLKAILSQIDSQTVPPASSGHSECADKVGSLSTSVEDERHAGFASMANSCAAKMQIVSRCFGRR